MSYEITDTKKEKEVLSSQNMSNYRGNTCNITGVTGIFSCSPQLGKYIHNSQIASTNITRINQHMIRLLNSILCGAGNDFVSISLRLKDESTLCTTSIPAATHSRTR